MIASLPMYSRKETEKACNTFWHHTKLALQEDGIEAPQKLGSPNSLLDHWRMPNLLISQTCGLPLSRYLLKYVHIIGTPDPCHDDCPPGNYYSVWIARKNDVRQRLETFEGTRFAFNDKNSRSGWEMPLIQCKLIGIKFGQFIETHNHRQSALAVYNGHADIAAIDAHSWRLMQMFDDFAMGLHVLDRTFSSLALPMITAYSDLVAPLHKAVTQAISSLSLEDKKLLACHQLISFDVADYITAISPEFELSIGNCTSEL